MDEFREPLGRILNHPEFWLRLAIIVDGAVALVRGRSVVVVLPDPSIRHNGSWWWVGVTVEVDMKKVSMNARMLDGRGSSESFR